MEVRSALKSQYHAALKTLHEVIDKCPDGMWNDPAMDGANPGVLQSQNDLRTSAPFWRVAYHTLFFAHFYLQQTQEGFRPWARHREEAQYIAVFWRLPYQLAEGVSRERTGRTATAGDQSRDRERFFATLPICNVGWQSTRRD